ncbi:hypothetical protein EI94DRAFT_1830439 [Lactarius quietus]|nr:hypothetical protein EI94DRAFT_1830439 [Lactarius quietus]
MTCGTVLASSSQFGIFVKVALLADRGFVEFASLQWTIAKLINSLFTLIAAAISPSLHVPPIDFLDNSTMLIMFVSFGRYLENSSKGKTSAALADLMIRNTVKVVPGDEVPADEVPADVTVVRGSSSMDESAIAGETLPSPQTSWPLPTASPALRPYRHITPGDHVIRLDTAVQGAHGLATPAYLPSSWQGRGVSQALYFRRRRRRMPTGLAEFEAREAQKSRTLIYVAIASSAPTPLPILALALADFPKRSSACAICALQDMGIEVGIAREGVWADISPKDKASVVWGLMERGSSSALFFRVSDVIGLKI